MFLIRGAVYWSVVVIMAFSVHTHSRFVSEYASGPTRFHSHTQSYNVTSILGSGVVSLKLRFKEPFFLAHQIGISAVLLI